MLGRMKDPVSGTALVVAADTVLPTANPVLFRGKLVVSAEGVPKTEVEHQQRWWRTGNAAVLSFWPKPGDTVPVLVDRANPTKLKIEWKRLIEQTSRSASEASALQEKQLLEAAYRDPERPSGM